MKPSNLFLLIQSDQEASRLARVGDDEQCAARCREIAPKIQIPLAAQQAQRILSARRKWAAVKGAANSTQSQSTRDACHTLLDWVTAQYDLEMAAPMETTLFADLVSASVLSKADVDALLDASMVADSISARDVSDAMRSQRPGGKI